MADCHPVQDSMWTLPNFSYHMNWFELSQWLTGPTVADRFTQSEICSVLANCLCLQCGQLEGGGGGGLLLFYIFKQLRYWHLHARSTADKKDDTELTRSTCMTLLHPQQSAASSGNIRSRVNQLHSRCFLSNGPNSFNLQKNKGSMMDHTVPVVYGLPG